MSDHRFSTRRSDDRPAPTGASNSDRARTRGTSLEEGFVPEVDELPRPAGFGTEATTSSTSTVLVAEYIVPDTSVGQLREASLSLESNGAAIVSLGGVNYGEYTGSADVTVPLDPGVLPPGGTIRVYHRSTDGNETTTRAQVVVLEV